MGLLRCIIAGIIIAGSMFLLLKKFKDKQKIIFIIYSFIPLVFLMIRFVYRFTISDHLGFLLHGLPLTLCGIAAVLIPITAITKNKIIANFLYFVSMPATIFALVLDNSSAEPLNSIAFWCFTIPHVTYPIVIVMMMAFKYIKAEIKKLPFVLVSFLVLITVMHLVNLTITAIWPTAGDPYTTNFVYTMYPGDRDGPPDYPDYPLKKFNLLKQAWELSGSTPYFYLYFLIPILIAVWLVLSLPLIKKQTYRKFFLKLPILKSRFAATAGAEAAIPAETTVTTAAAETADKASGQSDNKLE